MSATQERPVFGDSKWIDRTRATQGLRDDDVVLFGDAIASGLCSRGVEEFTCRHFGGRMRVTVGELSRWAWMAEVQQTLECAADRLRERCGFCGREREHAVWCIERKD